MTAPLFIALTHAGENEYAACMESIKAQTYQPVTVQVIENLGKKEAMDAVHRSFMQARGTHALFMHVGADMVFTRPTALAEAIAHFNAQDNVDQMLFCVRDFLPAKDVMGVHILSARASWPHDNDGLFTDPNPVIPGRKVSVWDAPAPFVMHAGDPSPYQAFHYGVHRGLKAFQPGRLFAHSRGYRLFETLEHVYAHFTRTGDIRPGLAMLGAEDARRGMLQENAANRDSHQARAAFLNWEKADADAIAGYINPFWGNAARRRLYWWACVGSRAALPYIGRCIGITGKMR